jgi:DNA-binding response OmpR family regulator
MYHVLVIDDDEQLRGLCRSVLEQSGFLVEDAPDGAAGLVKFDARPADVVLCDIYMPNKDGIETIQELTKAYFDVKVIAISGGAPGLPDYLMSARLLGAAGVLRKPFTPTELLDTVHEVLGRDPS